MLRGCEGRSEGRDSVDSESAPSVTENGGVAIESDFGGERAEAETGQDHCKPACRGCLHLKSVQLGAVLEAAASSGRPVPLSGWYSVVAGWRGERRRAHANHG